LNGPVGDERLANNINISIPGLDTEFAAVVLDSKGFAVSTKSACAGAGGGESAVVKAISGDAARISSSPEQAQARARSTLRFSLSPETTTAQLKDLAKALKDHIARMQTLTKA
jgi:cysteine desulfurase